MIAPVHHIQEVVCEHYHAPIVEMATVSRMWSPERHVAMYLARRLTDKSWLQIATAFGNRHHTSVMYAVSQIESRRRQDPTLELDLTVMGLRIVQDMRG